MAEFFTQHYLRWRVTSSIRVAAPNLQLALPCPSPFYEGILLYHSMVAHTVGVSMIDSVAHLQGWASGLNPVQADMKSLVSKRRSRLVPDNQCAVNPTSRCVIGRY